MADSFTPKFRDLVRCYTTTVGTGNFALGPAFNGFSSFGDVLQPGDQFYYSCVGLDKPAEREIGRGTLINATTVARSPVGGAATNFTKGNKAIALVAAGEWFGQIDQSVADLEVQVSALGAGGGPTDAVQIAEDVAKLSTLNSDDPAAILTEIGRDGAFRWDGSDQSALVAADPRRGIAIAPASDPSGASGAWVRQFEGLSVNVRWFGATGDGTTDDGPAFLAAIAFLKATGSPGATWYATNARLTVPEGTYFLGAHTLDITHSLRIEGVGSGFSGVPGATRLKWSANTTGIRIQSHNTDGIGNVNAGGQNSGGGTKISGMTLEGARVGGAEGEHHGIHAKARFSMEDFVVTGFAGDGVHIDATSLTADNNADPEGNANLFRLGDGALLGCRDGLFVRGADANAGSIVNVDASYNGRWGLGDQSFLGNTYVACHASGNGYGSASGGYSWCSHNGHCYAVKIGQEAGASTNAPSGTETDNQWWYYLYPGGPNPAVNRLAWVGGMTWRAGGAYAATNPNARSVFIGCYSEADQSCSQVLKPSMVIGGLHGATVKGSGGFLDGSGEGGLITPKLEATSLAAKTVEVGTFVGQGGGTAKMYSGFNGGDTLAFGARVAFGYYDSVGFTAYNTGSGPIPLMLKGSDLYWISGNDHTVRFQVNHDRARHEGYFDSAAGFRVGNVAIVDNARNASFASVVSDRGAIGYVAGAGGSVTQATSKSTGVTLNTASGRITMHNAALAASTAASFTLSNDKIAATDTIIVNIAGGASAGAYLASVDAVSAGSCIITLRNMTAGSLSDAPELNFAIIKGASA